VGRISAAVVLSALLVLLAEPGAQAARQSPTLGSRSYPGAGFPGRFPGFGAVAPRLISANGDANSRVSSIHWKGWDSSEAHGFGASYEFAPQGGYLPGLFPVQLRASDLGRCRRGGPVVYRHLWRHDRIDGGTAWSSWAAWPDVSYPRPQLLC
jgi:hypothetical protein